ncbi:MAG: bifunctional hydroxymethylpyrimidine kinase/phosphomethylpyrimidine kinase [Beijerinckiaceae bacterium]
MAAIPNILSVAGSDPSGGAGIQADLKTFAALGCYGMAVVTALTAQNTRGVAALHLPPAAFVAVQIDAIFDDIDVHAVKIGMLGSGEIVQTVSDRLRQRGAPFVVLDPVFVATSGDALGTSDIVGALRDDLMPFASLITPNLAEAARLADGSVPRDVAGMQRLAERLHARGARAVLVKGGHLAGAVATDVLFDGNAHRLFTTARLATDKTHGTGCTLSSAIAAFVAKGLAIGDAIEAAKEYLTGALAASSDLRVGHGAGPVHHFYKVSQDGWT